MSATGTLRIAGVIDATGASAERQSRALGGFLGKGLILPPEITAQVITHVFHTDGADRERLVSAAPRGGVRLTRTPPHRPDVLTGTLAAFQADVGADLYVLPGGPLGAELAARLAARTGGSAITGAVGAEYVVGGLTCRRSAYSGHLTAVMELGPRPWCLALDAGWMDARQIEDAGDTDCGAPTQNLARTVSEYTADARSAPAPLHDVEALEKPETGDLETARFLVVAGRGSGSRSGVARIAAAAASLGAVFGVTRPVVMNAWAPPDRQVGVSGTRAAPSVCIVAGASGAPAFIWGVERAAFIAAVDTDDHAPITTEADAVIVDDAVAVMEALAALLD